MGLRIFNNVEAQNAHRQLQMTNQHLSRTMEKLSSGLRINRAADDAAGLAVSEEMRTQIRGMRVASRNALDGVSLVQVADGALVGVNDMLQRVRDLAVQAANGTFSDQQRQNLDQEVQQVMSELAREEGALNLSQGFPDFDGPTALLDRVEHYLRSGHNQYAPMMGVPALRQAIQQDLKPIRQSCMP